jgi:spore coat protein JB
MKQLQSYAFAAYDAHLYLDAYPNSKEAMNFYNKYSKLASRTKAEYEQKYGPISAPTEATEWQWTKGPWPWQA